MTAALPSPTESGHPTDTHPKLSLSSRVEDETGNADTDSPNVNTPRLDGNASEPATIPTMSEAGEELGGGGEEAEQGEEAPSKEVSPQRRESSMWPNDMPPSPPLTRPSTAHGNEDETAEADITDSIPLQYNDESEENLDFSETFVAERGDEKDEEIEEEEEEKPRAATVVRKASHINTGAKLEPQPWDLIEPPQTNGDYYASLGRYNTLKSTRRARAPIPKSSYYVGPPPSDSAYGTPPMGQIGLHHPREILRVERDYSGGELIQFAPIYPLELEGRITPTQFLETINAINEILISAHSMKHSFLDNALAVFTLQLSRLLLTTHYEKEMRRLHALIDDLNAEMYNPVGLNILWPRKVAFLFMEIEYY